MGIFAIRGGDMLDQVIRNGSMIDGSGAERRRADIGIREGRIVAIGQVDEPAQRTLDASDLVTFAPNMSVP